jgi:gliding motility-associated transport system ATP-binding protein
MTVSDYLAFCSRIKGVPRSERATRLRTVMERTQIADVAKRHCAKLSKGYRQRVGLAQALLHNPEVLILDEPTAGLDPKQIIETRRLIKGLGGDHTIILSTHILPEVSQTCNRIVIINKGRVVAVDTPDNLTARLRGSETMYVQVDATGADPEGTLSSIPGVTRVSISDRRDSITGYEVDSESGRDVRRELAAAVVGRGWGLLELRPMRIGLEEIFLKVITEDAAATDAAAEASRE